MEASSVALKLRAQQATRHFFCDLAGLLACVAHACASAGEHAMLSPMRVPHERAP